MRDLKKAFAHVFQRFKPGSKIYAVFELFGYDAASSQEKFLYYNGQSFKSATFKDSMVGYPLSFFRRTKQMGRSIHQRKKKKKKK
jgi:hypothetical protein